MRAALFAFLMLPAAAGACNIILATQYQRQLTQAAQAVFGPLAPVAALAGQIHTESCWNVRAVSAAGAKGLAQFIDSTGRSVSKTYAVVGPHMPFDPGWAFRAQSALLHENWRKYSIGRNACSAWLMCFAGYNGSPAALDREVAACRATPGCDPWRWFGHVEEQVGRRMDYWTENRNYPKRILRNQAGYFAAGWGPGVCHAGES
jgi:soluble lytic murein transglycosylase-like protein